jgi:galactose oxidase
MSYKRTFHNSIVLPSGDVVVVGGQAFAKIFSDDNAVLTAETVEPWD